MKPQKVNMTGTIPVPTGTTCSAKDGVPKMHPLKDSGACFESGNLTKLAKSTTGPHDAGTISLTKTPS